MGTEPPHACLTCETKPPAVSDLTEVRCACCGRPLIVCSDGAVWPNTGMGGQTAAYHERSLHEQLSRPKLRDRRLVENVPLPGGRELHITLSAIIVSECDEWADGSRSTWYPFHLSLRSGCPRLKIRRSASGALGRAGERPVRRLRRDEQRATGEQWRRQNEISGS